jgi:RND family efflux transporter MFP subunit
MDTTGAGKQSLKPDRRGSNFWAIVTLVVVIVASAAIVHIFKKPGQMSVVESQSMDMSSMTPPKGALPVAIATVTNQSISGSVTYTGSAQAYEDEDIYPRIEGRISQMPVYPGDRVRKGQLLVLLDPANSSEYLARSNEAKFGAQAAEHDAGIAKQEFRQKQHLLEAAQDSEKAAGKAVEGAKANLDYWTPELKREAALLKRQVISQQEYDNEMAQYSAAQAKFEEAQAQQSQATQTKLAAQADYEAAMHHIGHRHAMAEQAEATAQSASIIDSYRKIVARDDGIVTRRLISPGVVVSPGTLILKVAHVKKMRLQAEIASDDIDKILVGTPIYFKTSEDGQEQEANVTSIFPAADPSSRTFIVEALIDNSSAMQQPQTGTGVTNITSLTKYRLLPGQYIVMRIVTGASRGLAIPSKALVWREGHTQVWKAEGDSNPLTAQLVDVKVGMANAENIQIISGLKEGDKVIFEGQTELAPGTPVVATQWGSAAPTKLPGASELGGHRLNADNHWSVKQTPDGLLLTVSMSPSPPKSSSNSLEITLNNRDGSPISGATIRAKTSMPGMNMPGPDLTATDKGGGRYDLKSDFMSGLWEAKLTIAAPGGHPQEVTLDAEVP